MSFKKINRLFNLSLALLFGLSVSSCVSNDEHEKVKSELSALQSQVNERDSIGNIMANKMDSIGIILDSLEFTEEQIVLNLEKGIPYDDYVTRLENIKSYLQKSNNELMEMEDLLSSAYAKNRVYEKMIQDYRRSLAEKDTLISQLTYAIEDVKTKNQMLVKSVHLQNEEIDQLQKEMGKKLEEVAQIENELDATKTEVIASKAEKYLSLAQSSEELANKTGSLFNGKKKKAYYRQAHEYYKKVLELDENHEIAKAKVSELGKKL